MFFVRLLACFSFRGSGDIWGCVKGIPHTQSLLSLQLCCCGLFCTGVTWSLNEWTDKPKGWDWGEMGSALQYQVLSLSRNLSPNFLSTVNSMALISDTSGDGSAQVLVSAVTVACERSREQGQWIPCDILWAPLTISTSSAIVALLLKIRVKQEVRMTKTGSGVPYQKEDNKVFQLASLKKEREQDIFFTVQILFPLPEGLV